MKNSILLMIAFCAYFIACGTIKTKIVGGIQVQSREEFAYVALLRYSQRPFCGGSIITSTYVLTAAHCSSYEKADLDLVVGQLKANDVSTVYKIANIYIHKNYSPLTGAADIALIEITGVFTWSPYIQPIDLAVNSPRLPTNCVVAGWGSTSYAKPALNPNLSYVQVPIVNWTQCHTLYNFTLDEKMICAGTLGKDSCQGDSGGPLVCNKTLVGIVSFGIGCAEVPGVYTEVAKYRDWVNERVNLTQAPKLNGLGNLTKPIVGVPIGVSLILLLIILAGL